MSALPANEVLSGVSGCISIACWLFVLVPQLVENYRSGSAEGISLAFLSVWFIGDLTNLAGALWAGLVPTVIALAIYFCFADIVLLSQCLYYKYLKSKSPLLEQLAETPEDEARQPLLVSRSNDIGLPGSRRRSSVSHRQRNGSIVAKDSASSSSAFLAKSWIRNSLAATAISILGVAGWAVAWQIGVWKPVDPDSEDSGIESNIGPAILGYISAVCYLGARIPQIVKNFKNRSCEGLSLLFFILSLLGNLTYGGSIVFHSIRGDYILTNLPWLIGSLGTMGEDITIFVQFRIYGDDTKESEESVA